MMQDIEGWSWKRVSTQLAERDGARPPVVALTFGGKVGFFFFFDCNNREKRGDRQ